MLTLYRRHLKTGFGLEKRDPCPNSGDRFVRKGDKCPMWVEGVDLNGNYHRKSLRTISWDTAERIVRDMQRLPSSPAAAETGALSEVPERAKQERPTFENARTVFLANIQAENRAADTIRKYQLLFRQLGDFGRLRRLSAIEDFTFEHLVAFRSSWKEKGVNTRNKKLDRLKAFFSFCHNAGLVARNPTKLMRPAASNGAMVQPFAAAEQTKILAKPQTARVRAFCEVLFYSALRISDAAMLKPSDLDGNRICRVNRKNQKTVFIPIPPDLKRQLDGVRLNGGYYFLIGDSENVHTQTDAWRSILNELFKKDVPGFHAHRFRHTAAVNWLASGLTLEEVAALLGNSVKVVEKHYASFCGPRQQVVEEKLAKVWAKPKTLIRVK